MAGRFGKKAEFVNEDVDFMSPSKPKGSAVMNKSEVPVKPQFKNSDDNAEFTKTNTRRITDVVTEEDLSTPLTGLNEIEGVELVYTKVRFGKGDKFEPDRTVAYCDAFNELTQEDLKVVTSAYHVIAQLEVAVAKNSFPFAARAIKNQDKKGRWELA